MAFDDYERVDESGIMDELREPWERKGSNIAHLMNQQEYREYCEKYKRLEKRICPKCEKSMVLRKGQYGEFFGCSGYPSCKYTEGLLR